MEKYFFQEKTKQIELKKVLDSWRHTPYRHWSGVKQRGCDCIHFELGVLNEYEFGPFTMPRYCRDWHLHNTEELLLTEFKKQFVDKGLAEQVSLSTPENGDLLFFKYGKAVSHVAIYFDKCLYQSIDQIGVEAINWMDRMWHKRKRFNYRLLACR